MFYAAFDTSLSGIPRASVTPLPYTGSVGLQAIADMTKLDLLRRYGVRWNGDPGFTAPSVLNAGCNYWGSAAGPGPLDGEPDPATPNVDVSTWNVTPTDLCTGA